MIGTENEIAGDGASNTRESSPNGHLLFYDGDGQEWRIAGEKDLLDGEKDVQTESHSSALQLPALDAAGLSGFVWRPSDGPPKAVSETRDSRTHGFLYAELLRILRRIKRVAGDGGPEVAEEHKGDPPSLNELELESLKQRVKTSESEAAGLRSAQAALFSAHNAIRKDFELAKTRISQLEREKTALKALEPARQAEMAKLRTRLIEIEAETGQQKGKWVEQLQERNRTLRHDLDAANWKIEKDAADMVGMKKSVARLEDENGRLRTMLQSAIQRQDADAEIIRRLEDEQRVFEKQLAILSRHAVERNKLVEDLEMERHNLARDKELLASQLILVEHQVELLEKELAVQKETMQAELRNLAEQEARARDDNGLLEDELAVLQEQRRKLEHDLRILTERIASIVPSLQALSHGAIRQVIFDMKPSDSVLVRNFVAFPAGPESIGIVEAGSPRSQTIQKAVSTLHFPNVKGSMLNLAHAASAAPVLSTRPEPPMRTRTSGRSAGPNAGLVSGSRGATELFAALGELEKAAVEAPKGYDLVARKLETEYTSVFKEFGGWIRRKLKRSGSTAEHGRR